MQVADGVHRLGHPLVNYYVVVDGGRATVVDAGLPADADGIVAALASAGVTPEQVEAVVLTHGHADHTGAAERLRTSPAAAGVHVHRHDVALAGGRPPLGALARMPMLARHMSREFLGVARFFVSRGLLRPSAVKVLDVFDDGDVLAVPGSPRVVHVPGHTPGSCALLLEQRGVLFTGDALVTHDCYSGRRGPRLMARESNDDSREALASLSRIERLPVRTLLPGHGDPWTGDVTEAVAAARAAGAA